MVHTLSTFGCTLLFSYEGQEQGCANLGQSKPKFSSIKSLLLLVIFAGLNFIITKQISGIFFFFT